MMTPFSRPIFRSIVADKISPQPHSTHGTHYISILLALGLHTAWFLSFPPSIPESEKIMLPTPISVSWIASIQPQKTLTPPLKAQAIQKIIEKNKTVEKTPRQKAKTVANHQAKPQTVKQAPLIHSIQQTTQNTMFETLSQENITDTLPHTSNIEKNIESSTTAVSSSANQSDSLSEEPIILPNLNASYLQNPAPTYPPLSRQNAEKGKVFLRAFINELGQVEKIIVKKSSGYERLDNAAFETVKTWRFVPAHRGNTAVSAWVIVPISFNLEG